MVEEDGDDLSAQLGGRRWPRELQEGGRGDKQIKPRSLKEHPPNEKDIVSIAR